MTVPNICFNCGKDHPIGARSCPHCGVRLRDAVTPVTSGDDNPKPLNAEELCQYASSVIDGILEPFAAGIPLISWASGSSDPFENLVPRGPDGLREGNGHRETFYLALSCLTVSLLSGKDDLSDVDAVFLRVVRKTFGPSYTAAEDQVSVDHLKAFYQQTYLVSATHVRGCRGVVGEIPVIVGPLEAYDTVHGTSFAERIRAMFFRFANSVVKADGRVTKREEQQLADLKVLLWTSGIKAVQTSASAAPQLSTTPQPQDTGKVGSRSAEAVLADLRGLVGLDVVKADVLRLVNFLKVQQLRRSKGMPEVTISHHLVFYGNPGTGKTTVARLVAELYRALGILSKGHLVETDRSGLVAGYVGQTALKVQEVVNKALGGILFVDEAYALSGKDSQDFGAEAVETLLKFMEDHREDLAVIVAGYTDKMEGFLTSNPGLKSRFNTYLRFDDYTPDQLCSIFVTFCQHAGYSLSPQAQSKVKQLFTNEYNRRDSAFGNARLARNTFERVINEQANRIVGLREVSQQLLATIEPDDIPDTAVRL